MKGTYKDWYNKVSINKSLAKEKNILEIDKYFDIQRKYQTLLYTYLDKVLNLQELDKKIDEADIYIKPVNFDLVPYFTSKFKWIYMRNFIFIEKLTKEALLYLEKLNDLSLNETNERFIETSIKEIIKDNYSDGKYSNELFNINYDLVALPDYFMPNDALILTVHVGSIYDEDEIVKEMEKQDNFFKELKKEYEKIYSSLLKMDVKILVVNDPYFDNNEI